MSIFINDETINDDIRMNKILLKTTIIFTALFSLNVAASPLDWQKVKRPIPSDDGKAKQNLLVVIPMGVLLERKHYQRKVKVTK